MILHHRWSGHRWVPIMVVLLGLLPLRAVQRTAPVVAAAPTGLSPADWQAIHAHLPPTEQVYLKASNPGVNDQFGYSMAMDGDTVVVGSPYEDSSSGINALPNEDAPDAGAAYVFVRTSGGWMQQAYLKASNPGAGDLFGASVAISGTMVVVGAYREDSSSGINAPPNEDAPDAGAAYVFGRSGNTWSQQAYLKAANTGGGDRFGVSVAVSGATVVAGALYEDSGSSGVNAPPNEAASNAGAAYVFVRRSILPGTFFWTQQAYLKASNTGVGDFFGRSVAVTGDTIVVGAPAEDSSSSGVNAPPNEAALDAGAVYGFVRVGNTWSQQAYLKASDPGSDDQLGQSVAINGNTVVVGAPYEDSSSSGVNAPPNEAAANAGAAYVFDRTGTTWSQQAYLKASNPDALDYFGASVAVSDATVVVGAPYEDSSSDSNAPPNEAAANAGAAYIFDRTGTTWSQQAYLKASNVGEVDAFGVSVAMSDTRIVVGAFGEDSSSGGAAPPNEMASDAGAAYVVVLAPQLYLPLLMR